jgi:uncharacterized RDD family membrane protein YckC
MLGRMARTFSSWLSGPPPSESGTPAQGRSDYPGQRLGLPEYGSGSVARLGRRTGAYLIDGVIASGLAALTVPLGIMSQEHYAQSLDSRFLALGIWLVLGVVCVRLFTFTPGQLVLGLMVVPVDGRPHVGIGRALVRNLLVILVIPALFTDADQRSIHDLATKTAVVRR